MHLRCRRASVPDHQQINLAAFTMASRAVRLTPVRLGILAILMATAHSTGFAHAQDRGKEQDKANTALPGDVALLKKLEQMEQRIRTLESQLKQKDVRGIEGANGQVPNSAAADAKPAKSQKDAKNPGDQKHPKDQKGSAAKPDWATPAPRDLTGKTAPVNTPNSILGLTGSPITGMSIGVYGEMAFGLQQNPAANGQWQNGFDAQDRKSVV